MSEVVASGTRGAPLGRVVIGQLAGVARAWIFAVAAVVVAPGVVVLAVTIAVVKPPTVASARRC